MIFFVERIMRLELNIVNGLEHHLAFAMTLTERHLLQHFILVDLSFLNDVLYLARGTRDDRRSILGEQVLIGVQVSLRAGGVTWL